LKEADEIYVIGFSMSAYDTMARFHFGSVIREREEKPGKVVVVEPRAAKLAETYLSVFGRPIALKVTKAEDVDWAELMS
jgi:hypothetical protein